MSYIIKSTNPFASTKLTEKGREKLSFLSVFIYLYKNDVMSKNLTIERFIEKSRLIHNDKYNYTNVIYRMNKTKVKIICPIHGEFEQTPNSHMSGIGCHLCASTKLTIESFIKKSRLVHNDKYDYSLVDYKNNKTKVKIVCPIHGEFKQEGGSHMSGIGCSGCSGKRRLTTEEFIIKSRLVHNDKYDYSLSNYKNATHKVKIICKKHGVFKQAPSHHSRGRGCPKCNESKGEKIIREFLINNEIGFIPQKTFKECIDINLLFFDFYLPEYNMCIEYDGRQHFEPIKKWGGMENLIDQQKKDKIKNVFCKNKDIKLIRISYKEDTEKKLYKKLCHIL